MSCFMLRVQDAGYCKKCNMLINLSENSGNLCPICDRRLESIEDLEDMIDECKIEEYENEESQIDVVKTVCKLFVFVIEDAIKIIDFVIFQNNLSKDVYDEFYDELWELYNCGRDELDYYMSDDDLNMYEFSFDSAYEFVVDVEYNTVLNSFSFINPRDIKFIHSIQSKD